MSGACHACGAVLRPGAAFCPECGIRQGGGPSPPVAAPSSASRQRIGAGMAAASDPGLRHAVNQDAFWMSGPGVGGAGSQALVCDGVSRSQEPHMASGTAAMRGGEALLKGASWEDVVSMAQEGVAGLPFDERSPLSPPSTTFVGLRLRAGPAAGSIDASWAWVGDSRIYWLPADRGASPRLLTEGHVAEDGSLLRCIGRDADSTPGTGRASLPRGGRILLCTDGLWGYDPSMQACALRAARHADSMEACDALVSHALGCGGRDNVSVVLIRL